MERETHPAYPTIRNLVGMIRREVTIGREEEGYYFEILLEGLQKARHERVVK